MSKISESKTERLLRTAQKTLLKGDVETAKEMVVLAMTKEDAVQALDKLLPSVPEPAKEELEELTEEQVSSIRACAEDLVGAEQQMIATKILSKLERLEARKKLKRKRRKKA